MKTIGLLGGMSWESTVTYYKLINEEVGRRLGKLHSARIVLYSVDFEEIEVLQHEGRWTEAGNILADAAQALQRAGADLILICTNTMHMVAQQVQAAVAVPLLHIADAAAGRIKARGYKRVGLLGTRFTMTESFYKGRLMDHHGLDVLVPTPAEMDVVHRIIYEELCLGKIRSSSRAKFVKIAEDLNERGAEVVILGCTEIGLLLRARDTFTPLLDTTVVHAEAAVGWALAVDHDGDAPDP